ncbi:hypothetical protein [Micromonospora sp. WMMD710]|uniref:hypothetical protein n=1 Tax=Micromonospora sp. WMMD710 TaxID=3016085 RepID=UPI002417F14A|nr:hypothetical protein [Micromonospora sp. WMMD710]MDG4758366.1 hypothetical protein [Micromonospora sp. WMMD710]
MSELDRLRDAMRATERRGATLDLVAVMRAGRRLRTRRRLAGVGAATMATGLAATLVVVAVGAWPSDPPRVDRPPPVAVAPPGTAAASPVQRSATPTPPPTPPPTPALKPMGVVIDSGVRNGTDQRVYYVVGVSVPGEPGVSIGLAAGRRAPDGTLTTDILVNDVQGVDRRPGFHQIGYDERSSAVPVPTFGYFVGPAKRIIGTVGGRQVDARLTFWSVDNQVVIFWFDPTELTPGDRLDGIIARDSSGRRL